MITLDFDKMGGLVPAVVQDYETREVLMLGFMNEAAWRSTLETGRATFFSRSRKELWIKGKTSGHYQIVKEVRIDCDDDAVLLLVEQVGDAACHTGHRSCFHKEVRGDTVRVVDSPVFDPRKVYGK
ncbi:MAG: phosphoribosyl-AMP cyclohydrolase [Deltaproteobacteria bacterium]|nr:phosphoribosyl-AMP cyclohydrolase [Deltaproteobacteria bacterium]MBW1955133.1 phosphoribosyl-AMP cyclohydrolase [Deltaproteobacteria bacterium]MBW2040414.1 phosphoribosyl-AMP cyclohydrolase [Deltaproteobacteria bacterium]MBW2131839.1 phosphoribosyl-AMP cyclohydrolase [Deltaproteobacteria bacterium]